MKESEKKRRESRALRIPKFNVEGEFIYDQFGLNGDKKKEEKRTRASIALKDVFEKWHKEFLDKIPDHLLTVSDIHLGARRSQFDKFFLFLNFLKKYDSINILGDFFDLCMSDPFSICDKFNLIFRKLAEIQKNRIKITYILGNHEIPVTGDYERKFTQRKNEFFYKFKKTQIKPTFLKRSSLCQYILLTITEGRREPPPYNNLFLYNKCDNIDEVKKLMSSQLSSKGKYWCLLLHGYQFDPDFIRKVSAPIWKKFLKFENLNLKKALDTFYNGILKRGISLNEVNDNFQRINNFLINIFENCNTLESILRNPERENIYRNIEVELIDGILEILFNNDYNDLIQFFKTHGIDLDGLSAWDLNIQVDFRYIMSFKDVKKYALTLYAVDCFFFTGLGMSFRMRRIKKFLEKHELNQIAGVIYGHTHIKDKSIIHFAANPIHPIHVFNDGAWQHSNAEPNYAKIKLDGVIELEDFSKTSILP